MSLWVNENGVMKEITDVNKSNAINIVKLGIDDLDVSADQVKDYIINWAGWNKAAFNTEYKGELLIPIKTVDIGCTPELIGINYKTENFYQDDIDDSTDYSSTNSFILSNQTTTVTRTPIERIGYSSAERGDFGISVDLNILRQGKYAYLKAEYSYSMPFQTVTNQVTVQRNGKNVTYNPLLTPFKCAVMHLSGSNLIFYQSTEIHSYGGDYETTSALSTNLRVQASSTGGKGIAMYTIPILH